LSGVEITEKDRVESGTEIEKKQPFYASGKINKKHIVRGTFKRKKIWKNNQKSGG